MRFIEARSESIKIRPEQKLVYMNSWSNVDARVTGVRRFMGELVALVDESEGETNELMPAEST